MIETNYDILGRIRSETAALHVTLESSPVLKCLLSPQVNKQDYLRYIELSAIYHQLVETCSFPAVKYIIDDLDARRKNIHINRDLQILGKSKFSLQSYSASERSAAFHLGMVYVAEGSTLGGKVLLKHLRPTLKSIVPAFNLLDCYGDETASKWRKFTTQLGQYASTCSQKEQDEIVEGALNGFRINLSIFN